MRTQIDSVVVELGKVAQRLTGGCAYYLEAFLKARSRNSDLRSVAGKGADSHDGKRYRANGVDEGEGLGVGLLPLRLEILDPDVWGRSGKGVGLITAPLWPSTLEVVRNWLSKRHCYFYGSSSGAGCVRGALYCDSAGAQRLRPRLPKIRGMTS